MMNTTSNYQRLINKLDLFIRKYYMNRIIKGLLYTVGFVLVLFLLFSILEYNFYFGTGVRKVFFFGFLISSLGMVGYWVIDPVFRYFRLGSTISHQKAAEIIGDHFTDVKDKLINVLQLRQQSESLADVSLIEASIDQKTADINPVPFRAAIDLRKNRKYLRYALPPFLLLLILVFAAPSIIKDGTHRIINNGDEFVPEAPFAFSIENSELKVVQFDDYTLRVSADGTAIPDEAYINLNGFDYRMQKEKAGVFSYTFKNVQEATEFQIYSGKVKDEERALDVLVKPNLADISIDLNYPSYTGRKDETVKNTGDLVLPEGTSVRWNLKSLYTENIEFQFGEADKIEAKRQGDDFFYHDKRVRNSQPYKLYIGNDMIPVPDSVRYNLNVIKDQYPVINVEKLTDSIDQTLMYFMGSASDDYGLNALNFNYSIKEKSGAIKKSESIAMAKPDDRSVNYDYVFDTEELGLEPGDEVTFYFEVYDNDVVNGSKSSKTGIMTFAKPTIEELEEMKDVNEEEIKKDLLENLEETKKIQEQLKKLRDELLQKNELDWQDKKEIEELLEKQKELQEKMEEAKDRFDENQKNEEKFNPQNEETQKKQEKLNELFEKAMDPEKMELMKQIEELLQELNKEDAIQMMEEMQFNEENQEKEMERLLELYKQLEMEKEIQDMSEKLEEMAEKQEELAEQTEEAEEKNQDTDEIEKEQEKLNEEFEKMQEKMEEMEKQNEELSPPKNLDEKNQEEMEEIMEEMEQSQEQLQEQQKSNASKSQKSASEKMKKMAQSMMQQMQSGEMEQMEEDIAALRQLLENLVGLSFDQEQLFNDMRRTVSSTPRYVELVQEQFKIKNDFKIVEDSLNALALRQTDIESFVTEKVSEIKKNMKHGLDQMEERLIPEANQSQRSSMKNLNDLALMLNESLENMQQSMSSMMPGTQMCSKPGGKGQGKMGRVPMDKITKGQEELNGEMKGMQGKMKNGNGMSAKDFAQAAARQAALRKALEEMRDGKGEEGKGARELQEIIDQMDRIEEDLVNKKLDTEMLKRQQDIFTRLLEAEKAEQQRELDNKRKAEQAQEKRRELPPSMKEYLKKREAEIELYKTVSPDLKPYYKYLVDEYYRALKGEN